MFHKCRVCGKNKLWFLMTSIREEWFCFKCAIIALVSDEGKLFGNIDIIKTALQHHLESDRDTGKTLIEQGERLEKLIKEWIDEDSDEYYGHIS
jgi:hypothetical protein